MLSTVRLPVPLSVRSSSVTRVDQSKTVEVRIMQLSPKSSSMTLQGAAKKVIPCRIFQILGNSSEFFDETLLLYSLFIVT